MLNRLAILCIRGYQRFISPHKGYRCAYGVLHNSSGCSGAVIDILRDKGILAGMPAIKQRFADCKSACDELERRREDKKKNRCCIEPDDACDCVEFNKVCDATPDCGDCTPDFGPC
ncbi:membrane protein insertion efficiency factor YidD [Vibrio harveyi]|uniref:membrane protein insertion efficiency factor YidD n=1 Tax=Vibrio harveyi TaxID=669 RepID=UPI003CF75130